MSNKIINTGKAIGSTIMAVSSLILGKDTAATEQKNYDKIRISSSVQQVSRDSYLDSVKDPDTTE